ncbi:MAG: type III-A CRISPR-associated RAMP protein Csm5 [Ignavibacteriaceae bacterium]|nr:type III-A CRISPR-associated RAMP protein Csm5 [Ignavibacteriaceae bacterium]
MKLTFKSLSPVHIASGNKLQPFEYVVSDGFYHRINQNKAFEIIAKDSIENIDKFENWLKNRSADLEKEKDNFRSAQLRDSFNLKVFCDSILHNTELTTKILSEAISYKMEIPGGTGGKKEISELQKDAFNNPYIPGSSIKGAFRTALFYSVYRDLSDNERSKFHDQTLKSRNFFDNKTFRRKGDLLDEIFQQEFFHCGHKYFSRAENKTVTMFNDLRFDMLKLITVTDAIPVKIKTAVYPCNLYLINKDQQEQTPALETIDIGSEFEFEIKVNLVLLKEILNQTVHRDCSFWVGFENKFNRLFNLDIRNVKDEDKEKRIIQAIFDILFDFSGWVKDREGHWLERYNRIGRKSFDPYKGYPDKLTLIKLGFGTGFTGMTLYRHNDYYHNEGEGSQFFIEIIKAFNIGVPKDKKIEERKINAKNIPSSKRFISLHNNSIPVYNLGWGIILEPGEEFEITDDMIIDPESIPQQEFTISQPKQMAGKKTDKPKDYKQGDLAEAEFVKSESGKVFIRLVDQNLSDKELSFKYGAAERLEQAGKFYVRISAMKNGKVIEIQFGKF